MASRYFRFLSSEGLSASKTNHVSTSSPFRLNSSDMWLAQPMMPIGSD